MDSEIDDEEIIDINREIFFNDDVKTLEEINNFTDEHNLPRISEFIFTEKENLFLRNGTPLIEKNEPLIGPAIFINKEIGVRIYECLYRPITKTFFINDAPELEKFVREFIDSYDIHDAQNAAIIKYVNLAATDED